MSWAEVKVGRGRRARGVKGAVFFVTFFFVFNSGYISRGNWGYGPLKALMLGGLRQMSVLGLAEILMVEVMMWGTGSFFVRESETG